MAEVLESLEQTPLVLRLAEMNDDQFFKLCQMNQKQTHIYRPNTTPEVLENPPSLSGEPVLSGFVLNLPPVWAATARKKT